MVDQSSELKSILNGDSDPQGYAENVVVDISFQQGHAEVLHRLHGGVFQNPKRLTCKERLQLIEGGVSEMDKATLCQFLLSPPDIVLVSATVSRTLPAPWRTPYLERCHLAGGN